MLKILLATTNNILSNAFYVPLLYPAVCSILSLGLARIKSLGSDRVMACTSESSSRLKDVLHFKEFLKDVLSNK